MQIVDHEPQLWFLAEDDGLLYLDANCNHSFFSYSFMIELSPQEIAEYRNKGRSYLSRLAQDIQNSAPILAASNSIYKGRDISPLHGERLNAAIQNWRKNNAPI